MRRYNAPSYVPAVEQAPELDPLMQHSLTQNLERDVLVPALQNSFGGLGIGGLAAVLMFLRIDWGHSSLDTMGVVLHATYWGAGAFSLACAFRAFQDEAASLIYQWRRGWADGIANKERDWFEAECERLEIENRQLSAANAQMVRHVKVTTGRDELPNPAPRMAEDEYTEPLRDALVLCRFQDLHGKISRDTVVATGAMDRSRWEHAVTLLDHSGVPIKNGVMATSSPQATALVRQFVEKQRRQPGDFVSPFVQ